MVRYFSHEVADLQPALDMLKRQNIDDYKVSMLIAPDVTCITHVHVCMCMNEAFRREGSYTIIPTVEYWTACTLCRLVRISAYKFLCDTWTVGKLTPGPY